MGCGGHEGHWGVSLIRSFCRGDGFGMQRRRVRCGPGNMPTKAPPALPGPTTCTSIEDFFTTACQLSWFGVRFYGTVDVGGGYQTNGSRFAKFTGAGINYFLGKANNGGEWAFAPNALSGSNIGVQIKEPLGAGWS